jgi:hypothetical protein
MADAAFVVILKLQRGEGTIDGFADAVALQFPVHFRLEPRVPCYGAAMYDEDYSHSEVLST